MRLGLAPLILVAACSAPVRDLPLPIVDPGGPVAVSYGPSLLVDGAPDTCNGRRFLGLIGQDQTVLDSLQITGQVRVIRPGDAVTEDFSPERINFVIATDGTVFQIGCY